MSSSLKIIQLECGGTISIALDARIFDLTERDRVFVFGLLDFLQVELQGDKQKAPPQQPPQSSMPAARSGHRINDELLQEAAKMLQAGETVSATAIKLGVHRNSLHNAGLHFGYQPASDIPPVPLTPFVCRDCGGQCSAGASRCKECYAKKVAQNQERERAYKADVAERKRLREENKTLVAGGRVGSLVIESIKKERGSLNRPAIATCRCDCGNSRQLNLELLRQGLRGDESFQTCARHPAEESTPTAPAVLEPEPEDSQPIIATEEEDKIPVTTAQAEPEVIALAKKLYKENQAQCRKLGICPDAPFSSFVADAKDMLSWAKNNPGQPYVERYGSSVTSDDFVRTNYVQYQSPRH